MSVKNNAFALAAAAALGLAVTDGAKPIAEGLMNDYKVLALDIAQVDDKGRCVVFATVQKDAEPAQTRVVCAASGDVRLFADFGGVEGVVRRAKLQGSALVTYKRREKQGALGDPIGTLKTQYKSFKAEKIVGDKSLQVLAAKKTAAEALGWDNQVGTPEAAEYADYSDRQVSVQEWVDACSARVTALAAALTAAGVDPATVV